MPLDLPHGLRCRLRLFALCRRELQDHWFIAARRVIRINGLGEREIVAALMSVQNAAKPYETSHQVPEE